MIQNTHTQHLRAQIPILDGRISIAFTLYRLSYVHNVAFLTFEHLLSIFILARIHCVWGEMWQKSNSTKIIISFPLSILTYICYLLRCLGVIWVTPDCDLEAILC